MSKLGHTLFITSLVLIVVLTLVKLSIIGIPYYKISVEERFFNQAHTALKPSGALGHGYGIVGTLLIIFGVSMYMARKRYRWLSRMGNLKYWLEFHIFLCTLGPILILFHTSFKFGGIVAISFWSMVAVFLSGIIGRFIYIQIPRTIEGRELSLNEVKELKTDIGTLLKTSYSLNEESYNAIINCIDNNNSIKAVKSILSKNNLSKKESNDIIVLVKKDLSLNRKISRLLTMQKLFKYWHVAHLPFALVMFVIMIIHVVITITFGYKWIF
jgi:hypothetical protein